MIEQDIINEECCDTSSNDKAFIRRTKQLLKQYRYFVDTERAQGRKCTSYSRTLFMNCCLGLLFIPQTKLWGTPYFSTPVKDIGIDTSSFNIPGEKTEDLQLGGLLKHLRNALAHNHVTYHYNKRSDMTGVHFEDYSGKNNERLTFSGDMTYNTLEKLVLGISQMAIM